MNTRAPEYRTRLGAASAILGPALMSIGDLFHPAESWDPSVQVAILTDSGSRWYRAHLLLFIGMLLFVPGILEISKLGEARRPVAAHAARILLVISAGALSAVFVFEMLLGRFVSEGAGHAAAVTLLKTFQSIQLFGALAPGLLAFFVGIALFVRSISPLTPSLRWPAYAFAFGAILILGEIVLAQVLLSQIGNILMLVGGIGFARVLLRGQHHVSAF